MTPERSFYPSHDARSCGSWSCKPYFVFTRHVTGAHDAYLSRAATVTRSTGRTGLVSRTSVHPFRRPRHRSEGLVRCHRNQLILDCPLEYPPDTIDIVVDVATTMSGINHPLANNFQVFGPKLGGHHMSAKALDGTKSGANPVHLVRRFTVLDLNGFGESNVLQE